MKTHALASTTLTCSPSVSAHFTHCWVSLCASCRQFNCCRCNHFAQLLTCTRTPCRDSHCANGSFEVLSLQAGHGGVQKGANLRARGPSSSSVPLNVRTFVGLHVSSAARMIEKFFEAPRSGGTRSHCLMRRSSPGRAYDRNPVHHQ